MKRPKLTPFEFRIFRSLEGFVALAGKRLLVACSGGCDSVALVRVMAQIAPKLGAEIAVATVHHGRGEQGEARDQGVQAARRAAQAAKTEFFVIRYRGSRILKSESDLREFRLRVLEKLRREGQYSHLVFAHHADDLLETRMIRLIRGTGPQGLRAMSVASDSVLRPFLFEPRAAIVEYGRSSGLHWFEDPTNADLGPLRNWLRNEWLPSLEKKRPGSSKALARSLETFVEEFDIEEGGSSGFNRDLFARSHVRDRRRAISALLRHVGAKSFGRSHVEEVRKRLETAPQNAEFRLLGFDWKLNAQQIEVCAVQTPCYSRLSLLREVRS